MTQRMQKQWDNMAVNHTNFVQAGSPTTLSAVCPPVVWNISIQRSSTRGPHAPALQQKLNL